MASMSKKYRRSGFSQKIFIRVLNVGINPDLQIRMNSGCCYTRGLKVCQSIARINIWAEVGFALAAWAWVWAFNGVWQLEESCAWPPPDRNTLATIYQNSLSAGSCHLQRVNLRRSCIRQKSCPLGNYHFAVSPQELRIALGS